MRLLQVPIVWRAAVALAVAPILLLATGCPDKTKWSYSGSGSASYQCIDHSCSWSAQGTVVWVQSQSVGGLDPSTLLSVSPSEFTTIVSAPASNFSPNASSPAQATLTASTDTGYNSSITVNLQQVQSSTAPVNSGDAVFTYAIGSADTNQVTEWLQRVASNTSAAATITSNATLPLISANNPGTYTVSGQTNSSTTGVVNVGSATLAVPPPSNGCGVGGTKCYQ